MNFAISILNGFCLMLGAILAAVAMRLVFHVGVCG